MSATKIPVSFSDNRGDIIDILKREDIEYVTLITSKKGAVRGNHYHKDTIQFTYILSGRMKAFSKMPGEETKSFEMVTGDLIANVPLECHAFEALEDSTMLVMTRGPRGGDDYEQDTYRLETPLS